MILKFAMRLFLAAGLLGAATGLLPARASEPAAFIPVRAGKDGAIPEAVRAEALSVAGRDGAPRHLVILVHGWDTPYYASTASYETAALRFQAEFRRHDVSSGVIGLQWPSSAGAAREWVPRSFAGFVTRKVGFRNAVRDPYLSKLAVARAVGRVGLRQLVFDARRRFPGTRIHLVGHSMGTEVIAHAVEPEMTPVPRRGPRPYEPGRPCAVDLVALLGSDLDYDAAARAPQQPLAAEMVWTTFPKLEARQDMALRARRLPRGKAAFGNRVPLLRGEQYDRGIAERRLVYDVDDIPPDHEFLKYLSQARVRKLAEAAVTLDEPARRASPVLRELDAILQAPDDPGALAPYLDSPSASATLYALWRLEHALCGNSRHLVGGYSLRVLQRGMNVDWLARERETTDCRVVREGLWPGRRMRKEALSEGRLRWDPDPVHRTFFTRPFPATIPAWPEL